MIFDDGTAVAVCRWVNSLKRTRMEWTEEGRTHPANLNEVPDRTLHEDDLKEVLDRTHPADLNEVLDRTLHEDDLNEEPDRIHPADPKEEEDVEWSEVHQTVQDRCLEEPIVITECLEVTWKCTVDEEGTRGFKIII